jgi:signal transduction histidine kinase/CheY-like chemotaxis protein
MRAHCPGSGCSASKVGDETAAGYGTHRLRTLEQLMTPAVYFQDSIDRARPRTSAFATAREGHCDMTTFLAAPTSRVPLETVIGTAELATRPHRAPDYPAEIRALSDLAKALADAPHTIFQKLVDTALTMCGADSSGLSIEEADGEQEIFRWHAVAGEFAPHAMGTTPRRFSPCGTVVDLDATQLMIRLGRHFTYLDEVSPLIQEALLVPFHVNGKAVGTVWVVAHGTERHFDAEDARVLASIADFAGLARQVVASLEALQSEIRERTLAQQALRDADRVKDDFLAMLAHELRNPLAAIRNALLLLRRRPRDEVSGARARDVLDRQVANLVHLVDDLLDVSRIRLGKFALAREPIDLAGVLASAIESSRPMLVARNQRLTVRQPANAVPVYGDRVRLSQLVLNLLNNAAKYTAQGGDVSITVEADNQSTTISVKDSGIGIAQERLGQIFTLFAQAGQSPETSEGGLGVGLHLVKTIAELHGGTVSVISAGLGMGSEFVVRLPSGSVRATEPTMPTEVQAIAIPRESLRILIADDNVDAITTLALLLRHTGHTVEMAFDGEHAVRLAQSFKPDIILLDVGMPKLSGDAAARAIRATGLPALLVSLTGWSPLDLERRDQASVFDNHLTKPVEFAQVERLLCDFVPVPLLAQAGS